MTNRYLQDNFAPVREELTVADLAVTGRLPDHLDGRYLRIGPNPVDDVGEGHHWFLGDGMVHGVRIADGEAKWYRNRYVRSGHVAKRAGRALALGGLGQQRLRREHPRAPARGQDAGAGRGRVLAVRADRRAGDRRAHRLRRHPADDGLAAGRLLRPPARGPRHRRAARRLLQLAARQPGRLHGARHGRAGTPDRPDRGRRQPDDARLRPDRELRRPLRPARGLRQVARARGDAPGACGCPPG